jgi:hypothetical protein
MQTGLGEDGDTLSSLKQIESNLELLLEQREHIYKKSDATRKELIDKEKKLAVNKKFVKLQKKKDEEEEEFRNKAIRNLERLKKQENTKVFIGRK